MDITTEIKQVEIKLQKFVRAELAEIRRHRAAMVKFRASREALEARLNWLDALKRQGYLEVA